MEDAELVRRWLTSLKASGLRPRTVELYRSSVSRFMFDHIAVGLHEVTRAEVYAFLASWGEQGPSGRRQAAQALRSLFGYLVAEKEIRPESDPTAGVSTRKPVSRPPVALRAAELARILLAAYYRGGERRMGALALALGLGTRRMELAGIAPSDVVEGTVHLRVCKRGKDRWVPLSPLADAAIRMLKPWNNGTLLGGIKPQTLGAWANLAAKDSGLYEKVKQRPLHSLRASYATHLLNSGTPIHVVSEMLGHSSVATTGIYLVPFEEQKEAAGRSLVFT